jgi:hypothetical protein
LWHTRTGTVISICVRIGVAAGELIGAPGSFARPCNSPRVFARQPAIKVLISNVVAELCMGRACISSIGEVMLKGFGQPSAFTPRQKPDFRYRLCCAWQRTIRQQR